jgi:trimeric autotransporter adhesin
LLVPRRATTLLLAVALAATAFVLPGHPAEAVAADTPDTSAWVTNGDVHTVVHANGRTYMGGTFDQVGPNTGFGVPLDPATGSLAAITRSKVNGHVHAAVPNGAGGWFIAGDFTRVGPVSRHYAAEIRSDGSVGGWNPNPDLPVYALAFDGSNRVYIGGEFTTVRRSTAEGGGDVFTPGLAATKRSDGSIDLSLPLPKITPGRDANDARFAVKALSLAPDNARLYVGGSFTALGGVARSGLGAVNLTGSPALAAGWNPQPDGPIAAVVVSGPDRVFVGGAFSNIGGGARTGLAVLATGGTGELDPTWTITADGTVNALTLVPGGGRLFVGGAFSTIGGAARRGLTALFTGGAGAVDSGFAADTDANPGSAVLAMALSPDFSRLYAGGTFGSINGNGPRFLSALNSVSGAVDTGFDPKVASTVRAVATSSTVVYAGGDFSSVGGVIRRNVAALKGDGTLDQGFWADTDGEVNALLVSGNSLYIGGTYKNLPPASGGKHRGVTKVDAATGAVDHAFSVKIDSSVWTLGLAGSQLFIGGNFSTVNGTTQNKGASVDATTGALNAWDPNPDAGIHHLVVAPDQSKVYIAGDFGTVGGRNRTRLAAVNLTDGSATSWSPTPPAMIQKMALSPDGGTVYVALGGKYGIGNRAQAWRTTSNTRVWDVEGDGDFQAVAVTNSLVYIGGHFNMLGGNKIPRQHLTALDPATGTVQPWGPSIGGVHGVLDLYVTPQNVYVAGEFDNIGNEAIQGIARFTNFGDTPPITTPPTQPPATTPPTSPPGGGGNPGGGNPGGGNPDPGVVPANTRAGYWMVGADGKVYGFGEAGHFGNAAPAAGSSAVDLEPTPSGNGYWIVTDRGAVTTHGDAGFFGAPAANILARGETVTSLSATPTGRGYWIFTSRGRAMNFGDAAFYGDMSKVTLNGPVLDSIPTTSGRGYYMVASDGGIFAFGDAKFFGSMGGKPLNKPVQSLVPDGDGVGYWLVASDGGIFAFQAGFKGSMGGKPLNKPVTGMVRFADGYLMVGEDGGIFNFSSKPFLGSLGATPPARPIVSVAALG